MADGTGRGRMFAGMLLACVLFPGCDTLKDRRGLLRSILDRLRNLGFSVAQTGPADFVQKAWIAATCACRTASGAERMLDTAAIVLEHPGLELAQLDRQTVLFDPEA
jgi:uncharacterized protein YlxP (DUF503 family)